MPYLAYLSSPDEDSFDITVPSVSKLLFMKPLSLSLAPLKMKTVINLRASDKMLIQMFTITGGCTKINSTSDRPQSVVHRSAFEDL